MITDKKYHIKFLGNNNKRIILWKRNYCSKITKKKMPLSPKFLPVRSGYRIFRDKPVEVSFHSLFPAEVHLIGEGSVRRSFERTKNVIGIYFYSLFSYPINNARYSSILKQFNSLMIWQVICSK